MLKAEVLVSDVAMIYTLPSTIQRLRGRYQAIGTIEDRRRSGQPRMATDVKTASYVDCISTIFTRRYPSRLATVSARRVVGLQG